MFALLAVPSLMLLAPPDFERDVRPIIEASCVDCHAFGSAKGGFSIETRSTMLEHDNAVRPGDAAASRLVALVRGDDPDEVMPPKGDRLDETQVATLIAWIDAGAPWPKAVAFRHAHVERPSVLPRRPDLPPAGSGLTNPIDRVLDRYFAERDVRPAPIVDDATFLRRVWLDLVGLLPPAESIDAFITDDDPDKRAVLVRTLLDDGDAYAAHWMTMWNDLLRNDYQGTGYIDGGRRQITAWLYTALRDNVPYDRFVRGLVDPTPETAGFAAGIAWRGESSASQVTELQYARSVSQVFLGENLKCASCHDSFVDSWTLAETYGLAAIVAERPLELHRCDIPTGLLARAAFVYPEVGAIDPDASRDERLHQFADLMVSPDNGRLARTIVNRIWARLMGRGLVEPLDAMSTPAWDRDLLDTLAMHLVDHGYDLKTLIELIATSTAYQRAGAVADDDSFVFRGPGPRRMTAEQWIDAVWAITGTTPTAPEGSVPWPEDHDGLVRASLVRSNPLMRTLGRPNREQVVSERPDRLTMLQALELTNGNDLTQLLRRGATRWAARDLDDDTLIDTIFRSMLTRDPTDGERAVARAMLQEPAPASIEDLLWVMVMHPRFQVIE